MQKKTAIFCGSLLLISLITCLTIVPWISYKMYVLPSVERHEKSAETLFAQFRKDYASVESLVDWRVSGDRDAGQLLNRRLPWSHTKDNCQPDCDLELPEDLLDKLQTDTWLNLIIDNDPELPDISWMAALQDFDLWDLYGTEEANVWKNGAIAANTPQYKHLMGWVKLRLIAGVRKHDLRNASAEIRQLAKLVHSQGTVVATMVAIAMLKKESTLLKKLVKEENPQTNAIVAYPEESLEKLRHVCWTTGLIFYPTTPSWVLTEVLDRNNFELCRCTGLAEGLVTTRAIPHTIRGHFLPERQKILAHATAMHAGSCRLNPLLNAPEPLFNEDAKRISRIAPFLGPLWLKTLSGYLFAVGTPSAFKPYEEKN